MHMRIMGKCHSRCRKTDMHICLTRTALKRKPIRPVLVLMGWLESVNVFGMRNTEGVNGMLIHAIKSPPKPLQFLNTFQFEEKNKK